MTIPALQQMKRDGQKIVAVVVYDYQMAQIVDRAGVEIVSVGDSIGMTLWGHRDERDVTVDEMILACRAVRRGVTRALVSCDLPHSPAHEGTQSAVAAAMRLVREGGAEMVKVDTGAVVLDTVRALASADIAVWAQIDGAAQIPSPHTVEANAGPDLSIVEEARALEAAGAALLDFRHSGSAAGAAVVRAVAIPVLGGLGGGPWLDGRVRASASAIGYLAGALDDTTERYANVARIALDAIQTYADDVRAGRQVKGK